MLKNKLLSTMGGAPANYIEEVFQTWLYTGNGSTQTITNGIDLAGKGGLVWMKNRTNVQLHSLCDTVTGAGKYLNSASTAAQSSGSTFLQSFNSTGFDIGSTFNATGDAYVSWTFRKQPKFFDVVTYTGDGTGYRSFATTLGSAAGCIIIKDTSNAGAWYVYHRSLGDNNYLLLNTTDAASGVGFVRNVTASSFETSLNTSGRTYVAYLFAHNAGGFGLTGTDNVVSCGSYTGNGTTTGPVVTLGYEVQWFLVKRATGGTADWLVYDNMRGAGSNNTVKLQPNTSNAEDTMGEPISFTATGFQPIGTDSEINASGSTYIYIAIRRGPMKTPTTGTSVYTSASRTGTAGVIPRWVAGFPVDMGLRQSNVTAGGSDWQLGDRLRGAVQIKPNLTEAEEAQSVFTFDSMTGWSNLGAAGNNTSDRTWMFQRAPGFFDEVCYTGTGSATTVAHNLNVAPELMIVKSRSLSATNWRVYSDAIGAGNVLFLNLTDASAASSATWNSTAPTASVFSVGTSNNVNGSGSTYVAYLFASAPGVSKVGSYTGNGSNQTINCGFTGGARFVMIKRTDSTGDWYVWDTARGIVSGNDPRLSLNTTAAEVTTDDSVDTDSTGFVVNQLSATNINVNAATYIYLAIA